MKTLFAIGALLVIVGAIFTWGPGSTGTGLLLMLLSLPPIFLGLFLWLVRSAGGDESGNRDEPPE